MLTEYLQHFCDFVADLWHIQTRCLIYKTIRIDNRCIGYAKT